MNSCGERFLLVDVPCDGVVMGVVFSFVRVGFFGLRDADDCVCVVVMVN